VRFRPWLPWFLASAFGLVAASGCYTMIVHPKVENERPDSERLRVDCIDCHVDYHVYPFDPYDHYFGADYYWQNPRYGYYYGYPWWWDDYYWYYYFSPDDPDRYPPNPRDLSRPAYRGGLPQRAPAPTGSMGTLPTVDSRGNPLLPPRRETESTVDVGAGGATTDTAGVDGTKRSIDLLTPISPLKRLTGQAPWKRPTGGAGAKPPSLRSLPSESPDAKDPLPVDAAASGQGNPASAPPATKENAPVEDTKPAETDTRGRPKRKP
jgi:hypothetical protein